MKRSVTWFFLVLLLCCFAASQSSALGVAQDYIENETLRLMQGATYDLNLYLQNPDEEAVPVQLIISSNIAEIVNHQEIYNLSPKSYNTNAVVHIQAPDDAKVGQRYTVRYSLIPDQEQSGSGQIGMRMKISRTFTVLIVDEYGVGEVPESFFSRVLSSKIARVSLLVVLLFVIIGFVLFLLLKKSALLSKKLLNEKLSSGKANASLANKSSKKSTKNSSRKRFSKKETKKLAASLKDCKDEKEIRKVLDSELRKKK